MQERSPMNYIQRAAIAAYTDYKDNFLTIGTFASNYDLPLGLANDLLAKGKEWREDELRAFGQTCGADNFRKYLKGPLVKKGKTECPAEYFADVEDEADREEGDLG